MYFCPHPRRFPGNGQGRGPSRQVTPPRGRPQAPMQPQPPPQVIQPQILRQPQEPAAIPPLPEVTEEHAVNVILIEAKSKEKMKEPKIMPVKKARVSEEVAGPPSSMAMGEQGTLKDAKKRKKRSSTRRKITIKDFPLGSSEEPSSLMEDVSSQGPKLTWPQLLHLSSKMRRQWSKMISTRTTKVMGAVETQKCEDVLPVFEAYIKSQRIHKVYVDGGAQVCVMSEKMMNQLGLEVHGKSEFKAKMANNVSVKCVGVCKKVKITVCGIKVAVDMYVIPAKGEGYPIILGRPWLIAINARQDWEKGTLVLKPPGRKDKPGQVIVYNMKEGKKESLELETLEDESSTEDSLSMSEDTSQSSSEYDSSLEVCGIVLKGSTSNDGESLKGELKDDNLESMLAKDLLAEEKEGFKVMLRKHSTLFISDYRDISGVTVVEHHINLKPNQKPVVQKLRQLGKIKEKALLKEVKKLLQAGFIYPVEDSEWVSPVVVTPKKNGKWRICVDYKPLNTATKRDHFPLPFQDEILNEVAGHERYTVCDGYSGYFQISIATEHKKYTTFITPWGCFPYRVMPFGLTNAPSTFQRFMNYVFQPYFGKSSRVYIDDFCIYSSCILHVAKVNEGLSRLAQLGGQLNIAKCHIGEKQVTLLGHVVSSAGIQVDPSKVNALLALSSPTTLKELTSFIQKVRYFGRFIHQLSQLAFPLQRLTNAQTLVWDEESEGAFHEIKGVLSSLPTILPPLWDQPFFVNPNVGSNSLGAIILQKDPKTALMRPVYFASRVMKATEKEYTPVERMVLALIFATQRFCSYLLPWHFVIITMEDTFPYVLQHMDVSARISKWIVQLQEFDYRVMVEESTRAALADILTHQFKERKTKKETKRSSQLAPPTVKEFEDAFSLYFDGAYKRKEGKAAAGVVVFNPLNEKVMERGLILQEVSSNNEAKYAALLTGLEWCVSNNINRLNVYGDSMLIVKQVEGIWSCKSDKLASRLREVKSLLRKLPQVQIHYVGRAKNYVADALASECWKEATIGAIRLQEPKLQGKESLQDVINFLETGEPPPHLTKGERHWLARKAVRYRFLNEDFFSLGKDQVL